MRYSIEWHDDAINAAPEERASAADLKLFLQDRNATLHSRGHESADHVTIALYGLAEGLAHDWWSLFGGRDREVSFIKYRNGYIVPDIRMAFDGAAFEISARSYEHHNPDLRFYEVGAEVMNRGDAEQTLGAFVEETLKRLDDRGVGQTGAALRWARVQESRADADEAAFCEAAGALGLDPYQISDQHADLIEKAASFFDGETLTEYLAGIKEAAAQPLFDWIESAEARPADEAGLGDLRDIAGETVASTGAREGERGWALGYRRARAFRRTLGLSESHAFTSYGDLAPKLGAGPRYTPAGQVDGLRALRSDHADGIYIHLRDHGTSAATEQSHLFSFTRAVGDAVCFPTETRAPINELKAAYRQAAGRTFAAEFLAPIREIRSMRDDGRDDVTIADRFGVSTEVIRRQWENKDRIEAACAA